MKTRMPPLGVVAVAWSLAACTGDLVVGSDAGDEALTPPADSQTNSFSDGDLDARADDAGTLGPDAAADPQDATGTPPDDVTAQDAAGGPDAQPLEDATVSPPPDAAPDAAPASDAAPPPEDAAPDAPCAPTTEVCNGVDDDCDGMTDEDLGSDTCGVGACARTEPRCVDGVAQPCVPGAPTTEVCNGLDDNCDGNVDEGQGTRTCGLGVCTRTVAACVGGAPQACVPGPASAETCNGADDDCDGATDEDFAGLNGSCQAGTGACLRTGTLRCRADGAGTQCSAVAGSPTTETCNGADDDCDGMTDEGLGNITCGTGACMRSVAACMGGRAQTCTAGSPTTETCNGADDDCDGMTDEGLGNITCGTGACMRSVTACVGGRTQTCTAGSPATEVCNGIDDDCDGIVDDGCPIGIDVSATTRSSPLTGGSGGSLQTLECPAGQVAIGVYGRSGTALDRIGLDCGTPGVIENRGTYPFTYRFDIAPSGLSSPPAGGLGGNSFAWSVPYRDASIFGMQIYYTTIVTDFVATWQQHVLQGSIGSWSIGNGASSGVSYGFGSTTGTYYRWGCPNVDEAVGGLTVRAGTQIDAISVLCRRMTVRVR